MISLLLYGLSVGEIAKGSCLVQRAGLLTESLGTAQG